GDMLGDGVGQAGGAAAAVGWAVGPPVVLAGAVLGGEVAEFVGVVVAGRLADRADGERGGLDPVDVVVGVAAGQCRVAGAGLLGVSQQVAVRVPAVAACAQRRAAGPGGGLVSEVFGSEGVGGGGAGG